MAYESWPRDPSLGTLASGLLASGPWPPGPGLLALAGGQTDVQIYIRMYGQTKYPQCSKRQRPSGANAQKWVYLLYMGPTPQRVKIEI